MHEWNLREFLAKTDLGLDARTVGGLIELARQGETNVVDKLLAVASMLPDPKNANPYLLNLVYERNYAAVDFLLTNGADPDLQGALGSRSIHLAARFGDTPMVHLLLNHGANASYKVSGSTAEQIALAYDFTETAYYLAIAYARQEGAAGVADEAFLQAAGTGNLEGVRLFVEAGVSRVNVKYSTGVTALHLAAQNGHLAVVQYLVLRGADIEALLVEHNLTPVVLAQQHGQTAVVEYLQNRALDLQAIIDGRAGLALLEAAGKGDLDKIEFLLSNKVDPHYANQHKLTPLHFAAALDQLPAVMLLLQFKADLEARAAGGYTSLYLAAEKGNLAVIEALAKAGANINACEDDGYSPLIAAAEAGHLPVAQLLLKLDAVAASSVIGGANSLYVAAQNGHFALVDLLLKHGLSANSADTQTGTALFIAAQFGHLQVVRLLLEHGAHVDALSAKGVSPLIIAAHEGHDAVVRVLLEFGAALNISFAGLSVKQLAGDHQLVVHALGKAEYQMLYKAPEASHVAAMVALSYADENAESFYVMARCHEGDMAKYSFFTPILELQHVCEAQG